MAYTKGGDCSTAAGVSRAGARTGLQLPGHGDMQGFDSSSPAMLRSQSSGAHARGMQTTSAMLRHIVADFGFAVKGALRSISKVALSVQGQLQNTTADVGSHCANQKLNPSHFRGDSMFKAGSRLRCCICNSQNANAKVTAHRIANEALEAKYTRSLKSCIAGGRAQDGAVSVST